MLDCTPEMDALLEAWRNDTTAAPYVTEFYTWTLSSGAVIRWTSADRDMTWNGNAYPRGPGIARGQISRQVGTQVSSLDVTLQYDDSVLQNGIPLAKFIASGGFSFSTFLFERAYSAAPSMPIVGTLPKFAGRMTQLKDAGETTATLTVSNWMSLLNVQVPVNVWQPPCLHTLFDAGCSLNRDDWAQAGIVQGSSDTLTVFTDIMTESGWFDLGKIVFTSGANAGQARTIKAQSGGVVALVRGLSTAPVPGDTFIAYPGCDLTSATCLSKFDNLTHRKGYDFIPTAETAAP
jgi:uncharacterized phage protein (TIGR02218 family)